MTDSINSYEDLLKLHIEAEHLMEDGTEEGLRAGAEKMEILLSYDPSWDYGTGFNNLGVCYMELYEDVKACNCFRQAVSYMPESDIFRANWIGAAVLTEEAPRALEIVDECFAANVFKLRLDSFAIQLIKDLKALSTRLNFTLPQFRERMEQSFPEYKALWSELTA